VSGKKNDGKVVGKGIGKMKDGMREGGTVIAVALKFEKEDEQLTIKF
jgi:hypothetical protein